MITFSFSFLFLFLLLLYMLLLLLSFHLLEKLSENFDNFHKKSASVKNDLGNNFRKNV